MIQLQLTGHEKDLGGGFVVRRLLPAAARRSVGPFIFFDHFGPVTVTPGAHHDVRPHPHIGLATVTYLFEGAMMHRDSLGSAQLIEPGAINWMTSGRGIVHSERKPEHLRETSYGVHGLQLWAALPLAHEEDEPSFVHTPAGAIPQLHGGRCAGARADRRGVRRALAGGDVRAHAVPRCHARRRRLAHAAPAGGRDGGVPGGGPNLDRRPAGARANAVRARARRARPRERARIRAVRRDRRRRAVDAPRHLWWNFVSSRKERILQAAEDWQAQRMGKVAGDDEFIPLPPTRFTPPEPIS